MTQEEKDLLLRDLSARMPYGCKVLDYNGDIVLLSSTELDAIKDDIPCKPFLHPISSMTEEELHELSRLINGRIELDCGIICSKSRGFAEGHEYLDVEDMFTIIDWLNKKMFDYRGLIEKGLAIEVTEENNPYEN